MKKKHVLIVLSILMSLGCPSPALYEAGKMKVIVWNETTKNPLPIRSEMWIRGIGSWWLAQATKYGSDSNLAPVEIGKRDKLFIYPDGRENGSEISVSYVVSSQMCTQGCDRDTLHITIYDSEVEISGKAMEEAIGKIKKKVKR